MTGDLIVGHSTLGGVVINGYPDGVSVSIANNVITGGGIQGSAGFDSIPKVGGVIANNLIVGSSGAGISLVSEPASQPWP